MNTMLIVWIAIAVVSGIVEAMTVALVSVWFVAGAAVGGLACMAGAPVWLQIILAIAASGGCVAVLRPLVFKPVTKEAKALDDFSGKIVSKEGIVSLPIKPGTEGQIKVDGSYWRARSYDESLELSEGERIMVCKVDGTTCIVARVET